MGYGTELLQPIFLKKQLKKSTNIHLKKKKKNSIIFPFYSQTLNLTQAWRFCLSSGNTYEPRLAFLHGLGEKGEVMSSSKED